MTAKHALGLAVVGFAAYYASTNFSGSLATAAPQVAPYAGYLTSAAAVVFGVWALQKV